MKQRVAPLAGAVLLLTCLPALSAEPSVITVTHLTDHIYQLSTDQGEYTTNSLVSVGDDGLLVVDTQAREDAAELKKVVGSFGKGLPKFIINTHRHVEHVGGNAIFGPEPVVIAHDLVRSKLRSGSYLFEEFPDATLPDITFADRISLFFNGERIDLIAMPGSHDDNEIIAHFTGSKVVHLSSLVNGFNFPSVDADGNALAFPELVARALAILPDDVVIVSGHNRNGTMEDLKSYHQMLVATIDTVRKGLAAGKTEAQLQEEKVLEPWSSYAGSYVSTDEWISYIVRAIEQTGQVKKPAVFEDLYHVFKKGGAEAAIAEYDRITVEQAEDFRIKETDLLAIGLKLEDRGLHQDAASFLRASLQRHPENKYAYYALFELAMAEEAVGQRARALEDARRALELEPDDQTIRDLVDRLQSEETVATTSSISDQR